MIKALANRLKPFFFFELSSVFAQFAYHSNRPDQKKAPQSTWSGSNFTVHKELVAQDREVFFHLFSLHRIYTHSFFIVRFRFGKVFDLRVENFGICHIGYRGKVVNKGWGNRQCLNGCGELAMQLGIQIPIPACICNVFDFLVVCSCVEWWSLLVELIKLKLCGEVTWFL